YYGIVLHAKGRLLYPDLNVTQYEPSYLNWTREGICHNTLLVDHESPAPGPFTTRSEFTPEVKFFAISGTAYKGTTQTRALLLAPEYLADFFQAGPAPGAAVGQGEVEHPTRCNNGIARGPLPEQQVPRPHVFDWVLHGLGKLYPGNPGAYRPTNAL